MVRNYYFDCAFDLISDKDELDDIASFIVSQDSSIPWHVTSATINNKKTDIELLEYAYAIGLKTRIKICIYWKCGRC